MLRSRRSGKGSLKRSGGLLATAALFVSTSGNDPAANKSGARAGGHKQCVGLRLVYLAEESIVAIHRVEADHGHPSAPAGRQRRTPAPVSDTSAGDLPPSSSPASSISQRSN